MSLLFIGPIGPFEMILIFMALVLLFGADKIPELAESVGESIEKFEKGKQDAREEIASSPYDETDAEDE